MSDFNKWIGLGSLAHNPQMKQSANGAVTNFILAITDRWNGPDGSHESTTLVPVVAFGGRAESAGKFLTKGCRVLVEGKLLIEPYKDDQQINRKRICVRAEKIHFVGPYNGPGYQELPPLADDIEPS